MPTEVLEMLNDWEAALPPRRCECGALVLRAAPGEPCDECKAECAPDFDCRVCEDTGRVPRRGAPGWTACAECDRWEETR